MMMPSIFGENLFDDWMDFPMEREFFGRRNPLYGKHEKNIMKTDVKETKSGYEIAMDLPGFKKEDVQVELHDGYMTIRAEKGLTKEEKDEEGHYIRRERYEGSCARSFYVGKQMEATDIKASFTDGILRLEVPKKEEKQLPKKSFIEIE